MVECIFCDIVNGKKSCEKIWENENFFAFADSNPVGEGHSLVVPKKHFDVFMDLEGVFLNGYASAIKETANILMKKYNGSGFNSIVNNGDVAGQAVNHVHFHILPRKKGDNKKGLFPGFPE